MMVEMIPCRKSVQVILILFVLAMAFFCVQYIGIRPVALPPFHAHDSSSEPCPAAVVDWRMVKTENMTPVQMLDYFLWTNRSSCRLAHDFGGHMMKKPSGYDGQKSVCIKPVEVAPPAGECLVYSVGINGEWSFDEAMESYGCQVYAFDPSMTVGDHDHTAAIHFYNLGFSSRDYTNGNGWRFRSLSSAYEMLKSKHGDRTIDYLKLDIEYDEWIVIPNIIKSGMMNKVRQLAIEIHLPVEDSLCKMRERVNIVRSIEEQGMVRFDSKINPWFYGTFIHLGVSGYRGYEIAWYNSKFYPANNKS